MIRGSHEEGGRAPQARWVFAGIAALALIAGSALWLVARPPSPVASPAILPAEISPAALLAASFSDARGAPVSLGQFQGKLVVVNFWATWCAPCREEMPAFSRLQEQWGARGVQFVGLSDEDPARVERFGRDLGIDYPLWVGRDDVGALARRLGNHSGVLPFTVLVDGQGRVIDQRAGPYTESELDAKLREISVKGS